MSPSSAELQRDDALDRLARANLEWIKACVNAIAAIPAGNAFTTDRLWEILDAPPEPRAMGAAICEARRRGLIASTHVYRKSTRRACNARPMLLWKRT